MTIGSSTAMSSLALRACCLHNQYQSVASSTIRRYASTIASKSVKRTSTGVPKVVLKTQPPRTPIAPPHSTNLNPDQINKQYKAKKLYSQGAQAIYRAPSHFGVLSVSWLLGLTFVGTTGLLLSLGHWKEQDQNSGLSKLQAMTISTGNRLGMIFFTGIGVVAVLRYKGLVTALDLVPRDGLVQLRVKVRRTVPFLKPKEYVVPTYDFRVPHRWILPMEDPAWVSNKQNQRKRDLNPLRAISKFFYTPFRWFRTYIFRDGIMKVKFQNGDKYALLDTNGWFSNDAKDFLDIATIDKPWDS